jgi:hypothetical protein
LLALLDEFNDQQGLSSLLIAGGQGVATNPKILTEAQLLLR